MDKLFTLYRYLAKNQNGDPENSYTVAYHALESFLDILNEMEYWGKRVHDHGGLDWDEAERLTQRLTEGFQAALCVINGDAVKAIHTFTESHLALEEYDTLFTLMEQTKEETEKLCSEDALGDLDEHPF
jgi:hypothetical protein